MVWIQIAVEPRHQRRMIRLSVYVRHIGYVGYEAGYHTNSRGSRSWVYFGGSLLLVIYDTMMGMGLEFWGGSDGPIFKVRLRNELE